MKGRRGLRLSDNDLVLLAALVEGRFYFTRDLADYFFSHRNAANRRLNKLKEAGYVDREQGSVTDDAVWRPTKRAETLVLAKGLLAPEEANWDWRHSKDTLHFQRHEAEVNRVKLAFDHHAAGGVHVDRCMSGHRLRDRIIDGDGRAYPICPDRYVELSIKGHVFHYFVEVDRSSGTITSKKGRRDIRDKLYGYSVYHRRGGFRDNPLYGPKGQARVFRVLVTTPTAARRNNIIEAMLAEMRRRRLPPSPMRGYALFADVAADPYRHLFIREVEVAGILDQFEQLPVDRPLASAFDGRRHADVLAAVPTRWHAQAYRRRRGQKVVVDTTVRDAFLAALIRTNRLRRYSVLEPVWGK